MNFKFSAFTSFRIRKSGVYHLSLGLYRRSTIEFEWLPVQSRNYVVGDKFIIGDKFLIGIGDMEAAQRDVEIVIVEDTHHQLQRDVAIVM